jgi:hypothetical protein
MSVGGVFAAVQLVLAVALNRLAVNRHRSRSYGRMIQAQWADEAGDSLAWDYLQMRRNLAKLYLIAEPVVTCSAVGDDLGALLFFTR